MLLKDFESLGDLGEQRKMEKEREVEVSYVLDIVKYL